MTAAVIIASGWRSGKTPFLPGRQVGSISAIRRIVLLLQNAGMKKIVVCGGDEETKKLVPSMNLVFLPAFADAEMLDCVQQGIAYLQGDADQILVCHVNVPLFSVRTVSALLEAEGVVCVPAYHGRCGHPILLRAECFPQILAYRAGDGLRGAVRASGFARTLVEVADQGILGDALDHEASQSLLDDHDARTLRLHYQLKIGREKIFYGPGIHQLLRLTQEQGSLADACKYMGVSYSKGRKIVQTMEEQMGFPVLITRQGGKGGGYSRLSEEAEEMLRRYGAFEEEAGETLRALFEKYFEL